jgi:hypothetical protein
MKTYAWIAGLLSLAGVAMVASGLGAAGEAKPSKLLRHIVMYKFKADVTPAQLQEVIDSFAGLPKKIDAIADFEHGPNVSKEGKSEGFTHCFVVSFRDEKGLETYLAHPAHADYVQVVKDRREKVVVFDYWATR